jgi:hypothetical protein
VRAVVLRTVDEGRGDLVVAVHLVEGGERERGDVRSIRVGEPLEQRRLQPAELVHDPFHHRTLLAQLVSARVRVLGVAAAACSERGHGITESDCRRAMSSQVRPSSRSTASVC